MAGTASPACAAERAAGVNMRRHATAQAAEPACHSDRERDALLVFRSLHIFSPLHKYSIDCSEIESALLHGLVRSSLSVPLRALCDGRGQSKLSERTEIQ